MEQNEFSEATMNWVQTIVVDLNLCPFAGKSILDNKLSQRVILSDNHEQILNDLMLEVSIMDTYKNFESSLVTIPNALFDFGSYLDLLDIANEVFEKHGYNGIYQLASFHPSYQFAGTEKDAPENYTNRSPYPIFHIIRESALTEKIDNYPGVEDIPENNIAIMNEMGIKKLEALIRNSNPHL